jgi:hypothetical protein
MITNIPTVPQLVNDSSKDIKLLHEYVVRLVQTLTEAPAFASDASIIQDDSGVGDVSLVLFEPEPPLDPFMVQGLQGLQGIQGLQGPPGIDADEPELSMSLPGPMAITWPVGAVFIAVVSTNPATLLGFGTWVAFGTGRVLIGLDSSDVNFDIVEETGGAKTIASAGTVSQPTFTGDVLSTHLHSADGSLATGPGIGVQNSTNVTPNISVNTDTHTHDVTGNTSATSGGTPGGIVSQPTFTGSSTSVVQPYIVVYMWKRTV